MPPQVYWGRSSGRVHNNLRPSIPNRSSGCVFRQDESSVANLLGARFGTGVRMSFQGLPLVKTSAFSSLGGMGLPIAIRQPWVPRDLADRA